MPKTEDEVDLDQLVFIMSRDQFKLLVNNACERHELLQTMKTLKEETRNILGAVVMLEKELMRHGDCSHWEYQKVEYYA